jgi:hypothetical protein
MLQARLLAAWPWSPQRRSDSSRKQGPQNAVPLSMIVAGFSQDLHRKRDGVHTNNSATGLIEPADFRDPSMRDMSSSSGTTFCCYYDREVHPLNGSFAGPRSAGAPRAVD